MKYNDLSEASKKNIEAFDVLLSTILNDVKDHDVAMRIFDLTVAYQKSESAYRDALFAFYGEKY